jgi:hypothetical protein
MDKKFWPFTFRLQQSKGYKVKAVQSPISKMTFAVIIQVSSQELLRQ